MLRLAFYKHPKADLCALWRRSWTFHVRSMKGGLNSLKFFLDCLKKWLQSLELRIPDGGGPSRSAPVPIMPSPAAITEGSSAQLESCRQPARHQRWQLKNTFFVSPPFLTFSDKRRIFPRPPSFSPHDISKFRLSHETRSGNLGMPPPPPSPPVY